MGSLGHDTGISTSSSSREMSYYEDKIDSLRDIFGTDEISLTGSGINVDDHHYPVIDDVIILLDAAQYPASVMARLGTDSGQADGPFAEDIQYTFGEEWKSFKHILPEHEQEFKQYFDLFNVRSLKDNKVCDLGCGIGRWSYFLRQYCRELVLVDFSDAIFVARQNLKDTSTALFFMGDLKRLPFRDNFADLVVCLGVLHHLPTNALEEVRLLKNYAPLLLIYLYYALDNRPPHFRLLLALTTAVRTLLSRIRSRRLRTLLTWTLALGVYRPLVILGELLRPLKLDRYVPLYEAYHGKSLHRVRQDVYDRFFTRIEQRFSRQEILQLTNSFLEVVVSEASPYWHFLCRR